MKKYLCFVFTLMLSSCSGQKNLDAVLIFDSKVRNDAAISIEKNDSLFFTNKYHWFVYKNLSLWGLEFNGIKYSYNYDDKINKEIKGMFATDKRIRNPVDYFGKVEYNFYFDKSTIGWLTETNDLNIEVLRTVDIEKGTQQEEIFRIPKPFQDLQPIIISPNKLLYHNYVLNSDNSIDTLVFDKNVFISFPHFDRVYMRKNRFMVDRYYELQSPHISDDYNAIDYFVIDGDRISFSAIDPSNVTISNYRVECNYDNIWFFSHKISPEKFLLYDVNSKKAFPFELDKSVFKLENMYLIELEPDIEDPFDVKFSYHTSMTDSNIYIYIIKDGIKVYKVSDYRKLLK